eukprot:snap_masked-scaffold_15-processed-gene-4.20-mRNA-1 protein AED:1.00 eAED:1.00 QI:0/0/0/0/1/1/2/0/104
MKYKQQLKEDEQTIKKDLVVDNINIAGSDDIIYFNFSCILISKEHVKHQLIKFNSEKTQSEEPNIKILANCDAKKETEDLRYAVIVLLFQNYIKRNMLSGAFKR